MKAALPPWTLPFRNESGSDFADVVASAGMSCSSSVKLLMQWASWDVRLKMPLRFVHGNSVFFSVFRWWMMRR